MEEEKKTAEDGEVFESIAARRLSHMHTENQPENEGILGSEPTKPTTFKEKIKNIWYHEKFLILAALVVLVVVGICVGQACARTENDVYILYAGPWFGCDTGKTPAQLESAFAAVMDDYNKDGIKTVAYRPIFLMSDAQLQALAAEYAGREEEMPMVNATLLAQNSELFLQEIQSGDTVLCLLDPTVFADLRAEGWIQPLGNYLETVPENDLDDYGIRLKDTDFGNYFAGVKDMPDDTILCLRATSVLNNSFGREEYAKELHARHEELLRAILRFTKPEEE